MTLAKLQSPDRLATSFAVALAALLALQGCRLGGALLEAAPEPTAAQVASVGISFSGSFSLDTGPCVGPITFTAKDSAGAALVVASDLSVTLAASSGKLYSDSAC